MLACCRLLSFAILAAIFSSESSFAQIALPSSPFLADRNGNGRRDITAFGDSITRGVGDVPATDEGVFEPFLPREEAGYPLRLEQVLGGNIDNQGIPGEFFIQEGVDRFMRLITNAPPDLVIISGGSNDARVAAHPQEYFRAVQKMVNVAVASNVQPLVMTPPPQCCEHAPFAGSVDLYILEMRSVAFLNDLPLADTARAYSNTCEIEDCSLLNLPEGLHPNSVGYDVFKEVLLAAIFQFDIFTITGQSAYESTFGLQPGGLITLPDPGSPTVAPTV